MDYTTPIDRNPDYPSRPAADPLRQQGASERPFSSGARLSEDYRYYGTHGLASPLWVEDPSAPVYLTGTFEQTVPAAQASRPLFIKEGDYPLSVVAIPGEGGTARVEFTLSPMTDVLKGEAIWVAWSEGDVSTENSAVLDGPVTALRLIATTAAATWQVKV